ncbi:hypothetical protein HZS38_03625 [Xenorhabdus nematophila]|uniref:Uncharacterized protein n=1 Tax=Xenorhabdus nematophila (strain ATCC 19061 / DSM 3370 / CCUG 14189 / LMG 1036 / NCIMB 9965 / AN6) TaxID=406817 RepID=D3VJQ1_XENNA|nr:hypothetical protein [Xenorhabdus nematophila]AYA39748.1 hypothetical protein D3790_04035 [Xenorhabdus nematophila]KHD27182.1 hypothetical protein LH67_20320 [Xenorhabdus nematophila]MBA0018317.1 hypothetical protein [Xenorhabdus nematophila]MCB4427067.1 hypothetical protein [Xenorhabdus nematophila]QNJ37395.1 hypothetical protein H8F46_04010 [Xenorhabdus nematophila]
MEMPKRKDAEEMLYHLLKRTLIHESDINDLMNSARNHEYGIPMKGIRARYDNMEKRELTKEDWDALDTLMHFYGP